MRENHYINEREVYLWLHAHGISDVCGFDVPQLHFFDNDLWAIEMSVVSAPFLLDFAGAYLDDPPDYPHEVVIESREKHAEIFEGDWPAVQMAVSALARFGIYMVDLHPGNIRCR